MTKREAMHQALENAAKRHGLEIATCRNCGNPFSRARNKPNPREFCNDLECAAIGRKLKLKPVT